MDNFPYISVVIPAYNERDYLEISLSSLANQSYPKNQYEIIVVDNNSSDDSCAMMKEYFPNVKLIENKTNFGKPFFSLTK